MDDLNTILESGTKEEISSFLNDWGLEIVNGKVIPKKSASKLWVEAYGYYDKAQMVRKVGLNSCYGALLNAGSRFFDQRLGQSTTLTGRSINRHQASKINEIITGEYREYGDSQIYCDTDSETADTVHVTSQGEKTVEELFNNCIEFWSDGDKEYAYDPDLMVLTYDSDRSEPYFGHIEYIYRHPVSKNMYEIEDQLGNKVTVTEDHSVMVERNFQLVEVKPKDINSDDILISVEIIRPAVELDNIVSLISNSTLPNNWQDLRGRITLVKNTVKSVKLVRRAEKEYVYDIGMRNSNQPWFFGNNMLLHNSVYFTAYPTLKPEIDSGNISWSKDTVIDLYDSFVPIINGSFPEFLKAKFNVPENRSDGVIKCGREIVAESGIWMVKKRYACLMIDKDGRRYDVDGKPGKVKAMGLDLKRADTPKFMQNFLSEILLDTLTGLGESAIIEKIREFKKRFEDMRPWQQGTPRSVNKLSQYKDKLEDYAVKKAQGYEIAAPSVPGHVTASLAWNRMREIHRDRHSMKITDGMRIIVCKLKITPENTMTSIAYPVDETRLPEWFVKLPFDSGEMMEGIVDKKIENLLGVLKWDLSRTSAEHEHMSTLFDFGAI